MVEHIPEMIVLDANILIRAVLGRRVREILETYIPRGHKFYAPDTAFNDAHTYLPDLLKKRNIPVDDVSASLEYLHAFIEQLDRDIYVLFEKDARERLRRRDENDWPVLASALALSCGVWTEDADFFGTGVPIWTTSRITIFLEQQLNFRRAQPDE